MKVLWITNIKLPALSRYLGENTMAIGGWMESSLNQLKKYPGIEFAVATFDNRNDLFDKTVDGVRYYLVPTHGKNPQKYNKKLEKHWISINNTFNPDVVHLHGTELPHGLAWIRACGSHNVCVSIQGLVSVCSRYYTTGSYLDYIPLTFRDLVRLDWISRQRKNFQKRGIYEKEILQSVNHIIGRTEWDKSHSWAINPKAQYHYCGETLRAEFYKHKWSYEKCIPHTIFLSQGNYPIKGLHNVLKALPLVLREYPDTKLYVGGWNIISTPWYRKGSYAVIIERLIKKLQLENHVVFTGMLDEKNMCQQFLSCNLFLLASAIENSPNSLGEAQLLGTPFITTYCGGTPEIVKEIPDCLYRYEEIESLAYKICHRFKDKKEAEIIIQTNNNIYDVDDNAIGIINIYKNLVSKE